MSSHFPNPVCAPLQGPGRFRTVRLTPWENPREQRLYLEMTVQWQEPGGPGDCPVFPPGLTGSDTHPQEPTLSRSSQSPERETGWEDLKDASNAHQSLAWGRITPTRVRTAGNSSGASPTGPLTEASKPCDADTRRHQAGAASALGRPGGAAGRRPWAARTRTGGRCPPGKTAGSGAAVHTHRGARRRKPGWRHTSPCG